MAETTTNLHTMERPKRPRTAYNYFFQDERQKLLQNLPEPARGKRKGRGHGKIAFADMAKVISAKWKVIDSERMIYYANSSNHDKFRYRQQMEEYKEAQREQQSCEEAAANSMDSILEPHVFRRAPSYAELASKLDKESIDFIISALK